MTAGTHGCGLFAQALYQWPCSPLHQDLCKNLTIHRGPASPNLKCLWCYNCRGSNEPQPCYRTEADRYIRPLTLTRPEVS